MPMGYSSLEIDCRVTQQGNFTIVQLGYHQQEVEDKSQVD